MKIPTIPDPAHVSYVMSESESFTGDTSERQSFTRTLTRDTILVPSSRQRNELINTILGTFSRGFRAHSEGVHPRGPKQNRYIPGFRLRKPRVRVALVQILLTCIPSQIICDSDPKILDTFDIFEDRSLQSI